MSTRHPRLRSTDVADSMMTEAYEQRMAGIDRKSAESIFKKVDTTAADLIKEAFMALEDLQTWTRVLAFPPEIASALQSAIKDTWLVMQHIDPSLAREMADKA